MCARRRRQEGAFCYCLKKSKISKYAERGFLYLTAAPNNCRLGRLQSLRRCHLPFAHSLLCEQANIVLNFSPIATAMCLSVFLSVIAPTVAIFIRF